MILRFMLAGLIAGVGLTFSSGAGRAETTLRAVTFTPSNVIYAKHFKEFAALVNERGKDVVQIQIIGGPEAIPVQKMGEAQMNGIADMFNLPPGLYLDLVPEGGAFTGSNKTPMQNRADGALDAINAIFHDKANAHVLAHVDGGMQFHVMLTEKPGITADGALDLSGMSLRSGPLFRAFMENLGATVVVMPPGEVYTGLERGVIQGAGYTIVGVRDFGWDKFLKYRIDPGFFQADVLISMNYDSWQGLSDEARDILNAVAAEYEQISFDEMAKATAEESAALAGEGMEVIELSGKQREEYLAGAYNTAWDRLKSRDSANHDALRKLFFDETR